MDTSSFHSLLIFSNSTCQMKESFPVGRPVPEGSQIARGDTWAGATDSAAYPLHSQGSQLSPQLPSP